MKNLDLLNHGLFLLKKNNIKGLLSPFSNDEIVVDGMEKFVSENLHLEAGESAMIRRRFLKQFRKMNIKNNETILQLFKVEKENCC